MDEVKIAGKISSSLLSLSDDSLLHILSYLSYIDLCRFGCLCHRLNFLSKHDFLWKKLCTIKWLDNKKDSKPRSTDLSWCEHFQKWFKDWGLYIDCYNTIRTAWTRVEEFLKENCRPVYESLCVPATEENIDNLEQILGFSLPLDLRCSYRIHDGQNLGSTSGLLGSNFLYGNHRSEYLAGLDLAKMGSNMAESRYGIKGCISISICIYTGCSQIMTLSELDADAGKLLPGAIFYLNQKQSAGGSRYKLDYFISGNNFTSWFISYAKNLTGRIYPIDGNSDILRFTSIPECVAKTAGFTVKVWTAFMPENSSLDLPKFFFAYRITIHMDTMEKNDPCKLLTRHWVITDDKNRIERVSGDGVIGEQPIFRPGLSHTWTSCTFFKTPRGNMKGHFIMVNQKTGIEFKILCPTFYMETLPFGSY